MITAELRGGNKPGLNEALGWIGSRVDDIYGAGVGRLDDVWIDPGTGMPRWLLVKEGRFGGRTTLIPFEDATAGAGHVWIPYERDVVRHAPEVQPGAPLTQAVESALRAHYAAAGGSHAAHTERRTQGQRPSYRQLPPQPDPVPAGAPDPRRHAPQAPVQQAAQPSAMGVPQRGMQPPAAQQGMPVDTGAGTAHGDDHGVRHARPPLPPAPRNPVAPDRNFAPAQHPPQQHPQAATPSPPAWPQQPPPPQQPTYAPQLLPQQRQPEPHAAPPAQQPPARPAPAPPPPSTLPRPPESGGPRPVPPPAPPSFEVADDETPVAIPVIHQLDRPQRIEIELAGELRISGELKGFSLKPADPPSSETPS